MHEQDAHRDDGLDGALVLVVVGAHPRAELHDRPVAYKLRDRIEASLVDNVGAPGGGVGAAAVKPGAWMCLVVTDVWYLNDASLRAWPVISIGGPSVNALTATMADRLPSAFVIDDVLMVQMDVELVELAACVWGVNAESTSSAAGVFTERYLDEFVRAAVSLGDASSGNAST